MNSRKHRNPTAFFAQLEDAFIVTGIKEAHLDVGIYDCRGKSIRRSRIDAGDADKREFRISKADLAKGAYLIRLSWDGGQFSKRAVVY